MVKYSLSLIFLGTPLTPFFHPSYNILYAYTISVSRIEKRLLKTPSRLSDRKSLENAALVAYIDYHGVPTEIPYTRYYRAKAGCLIEESTSRYRRYANIRKPYNRVAVASSYKVLPFFFYS